LLLLFFFFFQAEDGIRDRNVTGVQTCALPISCGLFYEWHEQNERWVEKGLAACERALAIEPQLAEALAARAQLFRAQKRYDQARSEERRVGKECGAGVAGEE